MPSVGEKAWTGFGNTAGRPSSPLRVGYFGALSLTGIVLCQQSTWWHCLLALWLLTFGDPAGRIGDWALERPSPRRIFCLCGSIRRCPLLVQSGHALVHRECPRSGVNRTSEITCRSRQTPRAHPPEWSQRADRFRDRGAIRRFPHNKPSYPGSNYTKIKARIP